jgi:hypothetical protein
MPPEEDLETSPKKLTWTLTPDLKAGVRFAETRISDLICQNDSQALEFKGYGKNFITRHGFSPDAFVQMAFQAAFYGLYGASALCAMCIGILPHLTMITAVGYAQAGWKARTNPR